MSDATENIKKKESATERVLADLMRRFEPTILDPKIAFELAETRLQEAMKPAILARETL